MRVVFSKPNKKSRKAHVAGCKNK